MRRPSFLVALFAACLPFTSARPKSPLVIQHVTIIDVRDGTRLRDRTVVIAGDRIVSVSVAKALNAGARVIDGRGRFLIPGLWDMHVHASWQGRPYYFWPLLLAYGVTGVREMGSYRDSLLYYRAFLRQHPLAGPRIVWASPILDGAPPVSDRAIGLASPEQARAVVDTLKSLRFDFLKVYDGLTRPVYDAVVQEARRQHMPFAGHTGFGFPPSYAAAQGQRSIEHLFNVVEECTPGLLEASAALRSLQKADVRSDSVAILQSRVDSLRFSGHDESRCEALAHTFAEHHTYQCPTLQTLRGEAGIFVMTRDDDRRRRWVPPDLEAHFSDEMAQDSAGSPNTRAARRALFENQLRMIRVLARAGVPILAGTDIPFPFIYPGEGLHEELALLVNAGLTPLQALQTATINPALFLHATDTLGAIAAGKVADLVLLDADPLLDINNTRRISAVVAKGHYFDRAGLDSLIHTAETIVAATRKR